MKYICSLCGIAKEQLHNHIWIEVPDACVCPIRSWTIPGDLKTKIPDVCDKFIGTDKQYCETCEHDKACHENR